MRSGTPGSQTMLTCQYHASRSTHERLPSISIKRIPANTQVCGYMINATNIIAANCTRQRARFNRAVFMRRHGNFNGVFLANVFNEPVLMSQK